MYLLKLLKILMHVMILYGEMSIMNKIFLLCLFLGYFWACNGFFNFVTFEWFVCIWFTFRSIEGFFSGSVYPALRPYYWCVWFRLCLFYIAFFGCRSGLSLIFFFWRRLFWLVLTSLFFWRLLFFIVAFSALMFWRL